VTVGAAGSSAIKHALDLAGAYLRSQPEAALIQAEAVLKELPGFPPAELIACQALRRLGNNSAAYTRLKQLARRESHVPAVLWELAQAASEAGAATDAIAALRRLTGLQPIVAGGWRLLAAELRKLGQDADARLADLSCISASAKDVELNRAAAAMKNGRLEDAKSILISRLESCPEDAAATRLLGEVTWRSGDMTEAMILVRRAVELAPGFDLARDFLIRLLMQCNRLSEALEQAEALIASPVANGGHTLLLASVLVRIGDQGRARAIYEDLLQKEPRQPQVWQNLGHVLKTLGEQSQAITAYRQAVAQQPTMGEAWWSLANLKTVKLTHEDIATMEGALLSLDSDDDKMKDDVFHLHFALGKALEDGGAYEASFQHYDRGNRLRRSLVAYDADEFLEEVQAVQQTFDASFFRSMSTDGCLSDAPIFVVGLPRSGSTLVEQILASHSLIEGTMELPEMMIIASRLQARVDAGEFGSYREMILSLTDADRRRLGGEYMDQTKVHRKTDKPFFLDKMPNNWQHVGLIKFLLPNARIIDVRRHPMACCFSGWKQHFARGQAFSYDLVEIGRYYNDYVARMRSHDTAAPGHVHRVVYERLVDGTQAEVERMLDYLGLPLEESCLAFWLNTRVVRTASSEQVRQPIFRSGLDQWRHYEAWLTPLTDVVAPLTTTYAQ
jgi:predicted Zn-dependent protease